VSPRDPFPAEQEDEIDLVSIWRTARKSKYLILITLCVCVGLAVLYCELVTPIFRAEVVIANAHDEEMGGGASSITSQIGGLASLAGLDMGSDKSDYDAKGVLNSRRLIEEFIRRKDLVSTLLPSKKKPPSMWFAVQRFKDRIVTIRDDKRTYLTTVDIDWTDAKTAAQWANDFVALANELIRTRALNDASRNLAYLNQQSALTNAVDMQRVIYNIIESEMKKLMLANGKVEYAFTVIDPAVTPEARKSPQTVIIVAAAFAFGLLMGIFLAFARDRLARQRRYAPQVP
jgi:uncharacterized protein involved in exopolysaccharide biosynthesis